MPTHEEVVEGVITDSPTVILEEPKEESVLQPVKTDVIPPTGERPVENLKAEMDRKFSRIEQMLGELAFANKPQTQQVEQAPSQSDEDIARLAAMGDAQAQLELTNRMTQRAMAADRIQRAIADQLRVIYARYPQLTDPSNPLTQAALRTKSVLRGLGQWPSENALDLEAIKTAIVENHELVSPPKPLPVAQNAPASAIEGSTVRRIPAKPGDIVITQKELDLAKRMGAKDPIAFIKKAKKGFEDRQAAGRSGLDPAAMIIIREQEGNK